MTVHLLQTHQEKSVRRLLNARRLTLRNFFLLWIHGFFLLLLLLLPELRPGSLGEQPYYVITPESLARRWKWRMWEVPICHSISLFWTEKKVTKENEYISVEKISFGILKSTLGKIIKSGVIVIGYLSAFVYLILLFLFCFFYADIFKITKSRNWKTERSQVWIFYRHCKLYSFKCSLFIWIFLLFLAFALVLMLE